MSEDDNLPALRGEGYEVWFLTFNDPAGGDGYWIRFTRSNSTAGISTGEVWFARFGAADPASTFGIHRTFERFDVAVAEEAFAVSMGDSFIRSGKTRGRLEGGGHDVSWDLEFPTGDPTFLLLPAPFYRSGLALTRPYSPNVDTAVSGRLVADGESIEFTAASAQQGHLYGRRHAERWAWAHSAEFVHEDAVVHALTAQVRRGPFLTPFVTTVGVLWQGRWIKLWSFHRKREFGLGTWKLDVGNRRYRVSGRVEAPARALIRARYEDPDGSPRFCHNTEIGSCRLALFERRAGGFEEVALLESQGMTHAEWAGRTPATFVEHEHLQVT